MTPRATRFVQAQKRGLLTVMLCSVGLGALAQATDDAPSVLRLSAGAETGNTNYIFTDADLAIVRQTRTQKLEFSVYTRLAEVTENTSDFGIIDPRVSLSYAAQSGPLDFNARYSFAVSDIDGQLVLIDADAPLTEDSFALATGTRVNQSGAVGFEIGARNPFGARLDLSFADVAYEDTTDPDLRDNTQRGADLSLRFDVTRVFSVNAGLGYSIDDRSDAVNTERERRRASLGVTANVNRVTQADATVRWTEIETARDDGAGGRTVTMEDGFGFDLGVTIDQRGGQNRFAYSRTVDVGGSDDRLTFSRDSELTKTQSLSYTVGAIKQGDDISFLGQVAFQQDLRNGGVSLSASQNGFVNDDGVRAISRRVSGSYNTALTSVSSLSVSASLASLDYNDPSLDDGSSRSAAVTYSHDLTRDWSVSASVQHTATTEGSVEESNTGLSVILNRDVTLFR